jgi:hypothetical protein
MSQSDKDRLADALGAMNSGESAAAGTGGGSVSTGPVAQQAGALDDDDAMMAPAPDRSVFLPKHRAGGAESADLRTKRTLIPILLTCGLLLPAIGTLKWAGGEDSAFASWDIWIPMLLAVAGLILLGLAVLNMLQVRHLLRRRHAV